MHGEFHIFQTHADLHADDFNQTASSIDLLFLRFANMMGSIVFKNQYFQDYANE
jgi:hypothetical protein